MLKERLLGVDLSLVQSFVYLFASLNWFANQVKNPDEILIHKKMTFWISVGLKLWAIAYLLRIMPANYFVQNDEEFFKLTNHVYQFSTIISYLIFLRGLFCKI